MMKKRIIVCLLIGCLAVSNAISVSAEESADVIATTEQYVTVDENAGIEENKDTAEQEEINIETTDSIYAEGGNAEDSVAGIQPFAAQSFSGQYSFQLSGLAADMFGQMDENYTNKRTSNPITFTPNVSEYGLEFEVPAGDEEAVTQGQANLGEKIGYAMRSALAAFQYDRPQVYWLRGLECSWSLQGKTSAGITHWSVSEITLTPTMYFENAAADRCKFEEGVDKAVEEISAQIEVSDTAYEKAKKIHDWINERLTYNYDAVNGGDEYLYAHTSYPLFVEGKGNAVVCEGYAKAFKILCNELGVGCTLVSGMSYTSSGNGPHMWNMMSMPDHQYYAVDLTWDDSGDAGYDTYFMVGANTKGFNTTFSQEHVMNPEIIEGGMSFVLPVLAEEAYEPDYLPGDIDVNGEVNSGDLAYMLQLTNKRIDISELTENQIKAGDVSRQEGEAAGTINSGDLATLLQYINGRIDNLG